MESPLFWLPCHVLGKCGRDYCPYFTDKETEALSPAEVKVCDDHVARRKGVILGQGP